MGLISGIGKFKQALQTGCAVCSESLEANSPVIFLFSKDERDEWRVNGIPDVDYDYETHKKTFEACSHLIHRKCLDNATPRGFNLKHRYRYCNVCDLIYWNE